MTKTNKENMGFKYKSETERNIATFVRLWAKILPVESGCWEWQGSTDEYGYGRLSVRNYPEMASRLILSLILGRKPERSEYACHTCDNPKCCNPNHIFLGSAADNSRDMVRKNRHHSKKDPARAAEIGKANAVHLPHYKGANHWQAKLIETQVRQIRDLYATGQTSISKLSEEFEVKYSTVHDIVRRRSWTHI